MYDHLKGKKALVTGSTSGIGLAIAERFLENGIDVILHGSRDTGYEMAEKLSAQYEATATYLRADLTKEDDILAMEAGIKNIDIMVHNAGLQHVASFEKFPIDKMKTLMQVHLLSTMQITQYPLEHMINQKWGRIIFMGSAHSFTASGGKAPYVTAKHALDGFSKALAVDLGRHNITSNAICPGFVDTPLVHKQIEDIAKAKGQTYEEVKEEFLKVHEIKGFVPISEIADSAIEICNKSSMTGNSVKLDCGWNAGGKALFLG